MSLPPPFVYLTKSAVLENSPQGQVVGTFKVIEGPYTLTLLDDAGGRFALDAQNHLIVTGALDFEEAAFHLIELRVSSPDEIIFEDVFRIKVQDVEGVSIKLNPYDFRHGALRGSSEDDEIAGCRLADRIAGRGGDDALHGRNGDDVLIGGHGQDRLFGNGGADRFIFRSAAESSVDAPDIIRGFRHSEGDKIDLRGIEARSLGGDQFDFIGNAGFGNHEGELRFDPATHLLQGDIDGDGAADFAIQINVGNLAGGDLLL
jgi:Ca2+-binding RTX toxin-like protein